MTLLPGRPCRGNPNLLPEAALAPVLGFHTSRLSLDCFHIERVAHIHTQTHRCIFQYNLIEHHLPGTFIWPGDSDTPVKCEAHAFSQVLLRGVGAEECVNIAEMVPLTLGKGVNTQDTSRISMYPADGMAAPQPGR